MQEIVSKSSFQCMPTPKSLRRTLHICTSHNEPQVQFYRAENCIRWRKLVSCWCAVGIKHIRQLMNAYSVHEQTPPPPKWLSDNVLTGCKMHLIYCLFSGRQQCVPMATRKSVPNVKQHHWCLLIDTTFVGQRRLALRTGRTMNESTVHSVIFTLFVCTRSNAPSTDRHTHTHTAYTQHYTTAVLVCRYFAKSIFAFDSFLLQYISSLMRHSAHNVVVHSILCGEPREPLLSFGLAHFEPVDQKPAVKSYETQFTQ